MHSNVPSILWSAIAAGGLLAACADESGLVAAKPKIGAIVVGDEPYAVNAAAAVMASGGDAADAATAMYFALSVTYPVAAGLGGGGICLVHDPANGRNEEFDFLARDSIGGGPFAVPGNVRGFAAMQAAYGVLPWQRAIAPAEGYAAAGFPISQALATRLKAAEDVVRLDAGLASEFMDEFGTCQVCRDHRDKSRACRDAFCNPCPGSRRILQWHDWRTDSGVFGGAGRGDYGSGVGGIPFGAPYSEHRALRRSADISSKHANRRWYIRGSVVRRNCPSRPY